MAEKQPLSMMDTLCDVCRNAWRMIDTCQRWQFELDVFQPENETLKRLVERNPGWMDARIQGDNGCTGGMLGCAYERGLQIEFPENLNGMFD